MQINITTHPLRYGNNNVTDAFQNKEIGFELEVRSEDSIHRQILTLNQVQNLQRQIKEALVSYMQFQNAVRL